MYHHTIYVKEDNGYIWATGCQHGKNLDDMWRTKRGFCNDSVIKIEMETLKSVSIGELMINSNIHNYLFLGRVNKSSPDPAHINDVERIELKTNFSKKDNLFLSLGKIDIVLLIDPHNEKILCKYSDGFFFQHEVDLLNSDEKVVFDNNRIMTDIDEAKKKLLDFSGDSN